MASGNTTILGKNNPCFPAALLLNDDFTAFNLHWSHDGCQQKKKKPPAVDWKSSLMFSEAAVKKMKPENSRAKAENGKKFSQKQHENLLQDLELMSDHLVLNFEGIV